MFSWINFLVRWIFTAFLVFGTYNPSGHSYFHWVMSENPNLPGLFSVGMVLLIAYILYFRTMFRSVKPAGAVMLSILIIAFNYMLIDVEVIEITARWQLEALSLVSFATLLTIGLCFSAIRARLAGQIDSDNVGAP